MTDLIERLEAATGPDRKLDVGIERAIGNAPYCEVDWPGWEKSCPHYTGSLDAAMSLIPEERWRVYALQEPYLTSKMDWFCGLDHRTEHYKHGSQIGEAATPALAICIAALKARMNDD